MQVKNIRIDIPLIEVLNRLRMQSTFFEKGFRERGENITCQCPFHKSGRERTPSGSFRKEDGLFHCFGCNTTAGLDKVVEYVLDEPNGLRWLFENFNGERTSFIITREKKTIRAELNLFQDKEEEYLKYKQSHPYFIQRKLHPRVIDFFDLGFDEKENSVTFPVKDVNGKCTFIARRKIDKKFFNYPKDVEKGLYGLFEIYTLMRRGIEIKEIYVTESIIDALTIWSFGKYAIALNGTGSFSQYKQISQLPFRKLILALDNDSAGETGCEKIKKQCKGKLFYRLDLGDRKDVNELKSKEEFEQCQVKLY